MATESSRAFLAQPFVKRIHPPLRLREESWQQHPILIDEFVVMNDERIDLEVLRRRWELRHVELKIQLRAGGLDRDSGDGERQRERGLMEMLLARRDQFRLRGQQRIETPPLRHELARKIGGDREHARVEVRNGRRARVSGNVRSLRQWKTEVREEPL